MGEGSQKIKNSSYKINKFWGYNVYSMVTIVSSTLFCILKLLRK